MSENELISQLKFRIANLESNLKQKQKAIDQYKFVESQADTKIKGMQKIHAEKIKSLLNSIQILKKQKASIQGLSKQHKRSKLIEQLNKEINDQDLVIQVLRQIVYNKFGKEDGRKVCDETVVKALNKGPQRIRPITREELRMEIQKLKEINMNYEKKIKQGVQGGNRGRAIDGDEVMSQISQISSNESQLVEGKREQMLNKIRSLQIEVEGLRLESSSKNKIIQKLKSSVLQGEKHKSEVELLKNEIQICNRKVYSFERILKENKEATNKKLIDLYQRELKVEELEVVGQQKSDQLQSLKQTQNLLLQQIQLEKQELQAKYEELKQQNQKIILQNISNKKHQENQKNKIEEIRNVNNKQKNQLEAKLKQYESQTKRIIDQNTKIQHQYHQLQTIIFQERAEWVQEKQKMIEELRMLRENKIGTEQTNQFMLQLQKLRDENRRLQDIFTNGDGTGGGRQADKLLLERLQAYKRKVEYYENIINKGEKSSDVNAYNELFNKYNQLMSDFEDYKQNNQDIKSKTKQNQRKQIIEMTRKEKQYYDDLTSGIDDLNLADVDSEILDNFNTSYEYSIHIDQNGKQTKMPKVSQADKELLKMINSDLWYFLKDDELTKKIEEASQLADSQANQNDKIKNYQRMRKLKNLSHPNGQKVKIYEEEVGRLDSISDSISVTSALANKINQYDSDVDIEFGRVNKDAPNNLNLDRLKNLSSQIGSDVLVSSLQSGDSNIKKKKKIKEKASKLKFSSKESKESSEIESELSEQLLNSDVSSVNISERKLKKIDSDVETDFKKKKRI